MSCAHWEDVDVLGFLAEPGAGAFAAFRTHYPGCAFCAAEVHAWTQLSRALGRAAGERHPREELLLAFESAPDALPAPERGAIAAHLAGCSLCREELASLRAFPGFAAPAPAAAARAASAPRARDAAGAGERARAAAPGRLRAALAALRGALAHPAPAYALALALLAVVARDQWLAGGPPAPEPPAALRERGAAGGAVPSARRGAAVPAEPVPAAQANPLAGPSLEDAAAPEETPAAATAAAASPSAASAAAAGAGEAPGGENRRPAADPSAEAAPLEQRVGRAPAQAPAAAQPPAPTETEIRPYALRGEAPSAAPQPIPSAAPEAPASAESAARPRALQGDRPLVAAASRGLAPEPARTGEAAPAEKAEAAGAPPAAAPPRAQDRAEPEPGARPRNAFAEADAEAARGRRTADSAQEEPASAAMRLAAPEPESDRFGRPLAGRRGLGGAQAERGASETDESEASADALAAERSRALDEEPPAPEAANALAPAGEAPGGAASALAPARALRQALRSGLLDDGDDAEVPARRVRLSGARTALGERSARDELELVIPLPRSRARRTARRGAAPGFAVRLRELDGGRELREVLRAGPGARPLEFRVPPRWLTPGRYALELFSADDQLLQRYELRISPAR